MGPLARRSGPITWTQFTCQSGERSHINNTRGRHPPRENAPVRPGEPWGDRFAREDAGSLRRLMFWMRGSSCFSIIIPLDSTVLGEKCTPRLVFRSPHDYRHEYAGDEGERDRFSPPPFLISPESRVVGELPKARTDGIRSSQLLITGGPSSVLKQQVSNRPPHPPQHSVR